MILGLLVGFMVGAIFMFIICTRPSEDARDNCRRY